MEPISASSSQVLFQPEHKAGWINHCQEEISFSTNFVKHYIEATEQVPCINPIHINSELHLQSYNLSFHPNVGSSNVCQQPTLANMPGGQKVTTPVNNDSKASTVIIIIIIHGAFTHGLP